jgi:hypothetical protein
MYLINFIFQTKVNCIITVARRRDHNMGSQPFLGFKCSPFRSKPNIGCRGKSLNLSDLKPHMTKCCTNYSKKQFTFWILQLLIWNSFFVWLQSTGTAFSPPPWPTYMKTWFHTVTSRDSSHCRCEVVAVHLHSMLCVQDSGIHADGKDSAGFLI